MDPNYFYFKYRIFFQIISVLNVVRKEVIDFIFEFNSKFPSLLIVLNLFFISELSLQNRHINYFYIGLIYLISFYLNKDRSLSFRIIIFVLYSFVFIYIVFSKQIQFQLMRSLNDDVYLFNDYYQYEILIDKYELDLINNRINGFGTIVSGKYKGLNIYFTLNKIRDIEAGTVLKVFARANFINFETVPGAFDESRWLAQTGTYYSMEINPLVNWEVLQYKQGKYFLLRYVYKLRYYVTNRLVEFSGIEAGGLNAAILYGDTTYLTKENKDIFNNLGLSHVLVASGSNVAIILNSGKSINSKIVKNYKTRSKINILVLIFYLLISLGDTSITRAIIMKVLEIINRNKNNKINPINYLCFSIIVMAIVNPYSLLNLGLKLSFMACLAVYTFNSFLNLIKKPTKEKDKNNIKKLSLRLLEYILFYVYIQMFLLILLWKPGYKISLIKIFSNVFFLPLFELILIWSCLFLSLIYFYIPATVIGFVLKFCFESLLFVFNFILKWELTMNLSSTLVLFLVFTLGFCLLRKILISRGSAFYQNLMSKYIYVASLVIILMFNAFYDYQKSGIYFVDVGQGDASIIRTSGKNVLIDTGKENKFNNLNLLLNYLEITCIDHVIITHFDIDHSGGINKLLENYEVKNIVISATIKDSKDVAVLQEFIKEKSYDTKISFFYANDKLKIKDLIIYFVGPSKAYNDRNKDSLCFYTYLNSKTVFWTGDIDSEVEDELVSRNTLHPVELLHVSHHGSKYSSSEKFIKKLNPSKAVLSVGINNKYGHPSSEVIEILKKHSSEIYRTDIMGTIFLPKDWNKDARKLCESKYLPINYDKIITNAKGG